LGAIVDGDGKMRRERKKGTVPGEFNGPLWDGSPRDSGERVVLEELVKASYENPDYFREEWVNPLLAEGLDLDSIFDLLLSGSLLPN
jgi:hypothetical protein